MDPVVMNKTQHLALIKSALGFLQDEMGFLLRENPPQYYYFESTNCEILVIFEMSKVYVSIGPIGIAKSKLLKSGIRTGRVDVKIVSQCLNPQLVFAQIPWNAKINLQAELDVYAKLIKQYCGKMVTGDFLEWASIQSCLRGRREQRK